MLVLILIAGSGGARKDEGGITTPPCQEKYLCESVSVIESEYCGKFIASEEKGYIMVVLLLSEVIIDV